MLKEEERREREQAIYRAVLRLAGDGADISRLRVQEDRRRGRHGQRHGVRILCFQG